MFQVLTPDYRYQWWFSIDDEIQNGRIRKQKINNEKKSHKLWITTNLSTGACNTPLKKCTIATGHVPSFPPRPKMLLHCRQAEWLTRRAGPGHPGQVDQPWRPVMEGNRHKGRKGRWRNSRLPDYFRLTSGPFSSPFVSFCKYRIAFWWLKIWNNSQEFHR